MTGINKVILIGSLGQDPVENNSVTKVSIATSESWKDKNTGELSEKTEWHRVVFFNRLAEVAAQYLKKGSKVYIEGSLRTSKWTDKEGLDRYTTEIIANKLEMLNSKSNSDSEAPVNKKNAAHMPMTHGDLGEALNKINKKGAYESMSFIDDDLPF